MQHAWVEGVRLTAAVLATGVLAAYPAWVTAGAKGLEGLAWAGLICLVPGWLALLVAEAMHGAGRPLAAMLASMGLRMALVMASTVVFLVVRRDLRLKEFVVWLLVYYGVTLAIETRALLAGTQGKTASR